MWLLALALVADTVHTFSLALSPAESVAVTVTGTGQAVVLVPGLFGSAFGYRAVIPLLTDAGYRAIVLEPLGIGSAARAGAIAAAPPRGAVPGPSARRDGDTRGRSQRGGSRGVGRRAPGVRCGQCSRGRALHP